MARIVPLHQLCRISAAIARQQKDTDHVWNNAPGLGPYARQPARHGRIMPRTAPGIAYLIFMLIGAGTVFLVAHQPVSYGIGTVTILLLIAGYGVDNIRFLGRARRYLETVFLSLTTFLLMVPTVTEILRRVPDGHPFVTDLKSPLLLGSQAALLAVLILGLAAQLIALRRQNGRIT